MDMLVNVSDGSCQEYCPLDPRDTMDGFDPFDPFDAVVDKGEVSFEGSGCAISVASASLLTESVAGLSTDEALERFSRVVEALTGNDPSHSEDLGKLAALLGVREYPSRVKCATLSWHALNAALNETTEPATTE